MERLIEAAKGGRNEARHRRLLLLMFRHGLRVTELCRLKLDQLDADGRVLHVLRLKRGLSTTVHYPPFATGRIARNRRLAEEAVPYEGM